MRDLRLEKLMVLVKTCNIYIYFPPPPFLLHFEH